MALRVLQENTNIKNLIDEEFFNKLQENFEDSKIIPIAVAFAIEKEDIPTDNINIIHRNDTDVEKNIVLIDISNNPEHMDNVLKSLM